MTQKHPEIAARMKAIRIASGHSSQTDFAGFLGVDVKRWNNVERGFPVSRMMAQILVQKIGGLSLDWIYEGNEAGLAVATRDQLRKAQDQSEGKERSR
jgi:hypothetical protein